MRKNKTVEFVDLLIMYNTPFPVAKGTEFVTIGKDKRAECDNEGIDSNRLVALSDYFETKMIGPKGYIPLTVFNIQWLKQDLIQQSFRSCTTCQPL